MFISKEPGSVRADILSGFTVALALVPEAVAFAFVAGVPPVVGLYGAFMMGLITSIFGGRPGMISGATGAMAVVMVSLVKEGNAMGGAGDHAGLQYLFATLILAGALQIAAGGLRLGKFVRMIPSPVMMGFVNGLAIVIFLSQLGMFQSAGTWLGGAELGVMLGLTAATMAIMVGLPHLTTKVPAALTAILAVSLVTIVAGIDTPTVASFIADRGGDGIEAGLPSFAVPVIPLNFETLAFIFPYAGILAAIGLIESLMTLNLIDELTDSRGDANRECLAQGAANITNGLFGGMGGCAMIGQSIINIKSGGRARLSGIVASVGLLMFILFGARYIEMVPIAALVGVMFMVVIGTFAWNTFRILNKVPVADVAVMGLVTGLTVAFDLAVAVLCGVVVSALVFAWENALRIRARKHVDEQGVKHYEIYGPLFFGSTTLFASKFDVAGDPDEVVVDFAESRIADHSAIEAINKLAERYQAANKRLRLRHLSPDCIKLIRRAEKICDVNVLEDPEYYVAVDNYRRSLTKALGGRDAASIDGENLRELAREGRRLHATDPR
ncbi:sulfate permease (SulP) [Plesiocystis pacifica SIR-1]|uniref:Sulfate permease (SulP) n=1 Tax=Plesiocystis pacifica SIR-1 TaxID=391625 RepID=A6G2F1_9BACT|nr:SulP family inorganic anion transporter [Plesiocystis pacifica]EDM79888.1 sulfate permease (SulP) [Plesiocystis pacifica SIR-1]